MSKIIIFTDGSADLKGFGGWGWVRDIGGDIVKAHGPLYKATNQTAELFAAFKALEDLYMMTAEEIIVYSDSKFLVEGMNEWVIGWKIDAKARKSEVWHTASGTVVVHQQLWEALWLLSRPHAISWEWVKGHSGIEGNEIADGLASQGLNTARLEGFVKENPNAFE